MKYLLDTCVLSEMTRARPSESVVAWLSAQDPQSLYVSALTIGEAERNGLKRPSVDALIAATALTHHMTLVTRNVADMAGMGVSLFNPFEQGAQD